MNRLSTICVAALLVMLVTAVAARADYAAGTVMDIYPDQQRLVVADKNGMHTFMMDEDFQVLVNGRPGVLEDLHVGDHVSIVYRMDEADMLAIEIRCKR
jgi:hypothetical protein